MTTYIYEVRRPPSKPKRRRRLPVVLLAAALMVPATATAAQAAEYCGHGTSYGWTSKSSYVYAKTIDGQHVHVMMKTGYLSSTSSYYTCRP